jgi:hypothetical protein
MATKVLFGQERTLALAGAIYVAGYFVSGAVFGPRMSNDVELSRRRAGVCLWLLYTCFWVIARVWNLTAVPVTPSHPALLDVVGWVGFGAAIASGLAWLATWKPAGGAMVLLKLRGAKEEERAFGDRVAVWLGIIATFIYLGWWIGHPGP